MRTLAITLLLSTGMLWAQSTTPQTPPPPAKAQTGTAHGTHHAAATAKGQTGMMQEHMRDMQAMLQQIRAKMDSMRADINRVQDPAAKAALQSDYDLWQTIYSGMQQMQANMQQMHQHMMGSQGMMGPGTMGGQSGMMGMHSMHGKPGSTPPATANPSAPTTTPPPQR